MIVHVVDTVRAVCVVSLVGQICMISNIGAIGHRGDRHFTAHRVIFGVYWHAICSTCEDLILVHVGRDVIIGPNLMRQIRKIMIPRSSTLIRIDHHRIIIVIEFGVVVVLAEISSLFLEHFLLFLEAHQVRQRESHILCAVIGTRLILNVLGLHIFGGCLLSLVLNLIFSCVTRSVIHFGALLEVSWPWVFTSVLNIKFVLDVLRLLKPSDLSSIWVQNAGGHGGLNRAQGYIWLGLRGLLEVQIVDIA